MKPISLSDTGGNDKTIRRELKRRKKVQPNDNRKSVQLIARLGKKAR